ncbi:hypothetical protein BVRB_9g223260 [Beta vulgaris subsp. vulgaris]|nr:hypothetical protein BVRB_9g223260 [Beta vulgaris subsp. vulgaris]
MCRNSIIHIVDEDGKEGEEVVAWGRFGGNRPQMVLVDGVVAGSDDGVG